MSGGHRLQGHVLSERKAIDPRTIKVPPHTIPTRPQPVASQEFASLDQVQGDTCVVLLAAKKQFFNSIGTNVDVAPTTFAARGWPCFSFVRRLGS